MKEYKYIIIGLLTMVLVFSLFACKSEESEQIDVCDHAWDEGVITQAPNCNRKGIIEYTCTVCGQKEQRAIDKTQHDFESTTIAESTCSSEGKIRYVCKICNYSYSETIPTKEHSLKSEVIKEPTCISKGLLEYNCTVCAYSRIDEIDKIDHSFDGGVVTLAATEFDTGTMSYTCSSCGKVKTEVIPHTGEHTFTDKKVILLEPTPKEDGEVLVICDCCYERSYEKITYTDYKALLDEQIELNDVITLEDFGGGTHTEMSPRHTACPLFTTQKINTPESW